VHHSIVVDETNSNFGFNLPSWDRLLGTYRAQPVSGHDLMTIGIEQFREARELWLDRMLLQPCFNRRWFICCVGRSASRETSKRVRKRSAAFG
jgi:sterol desaturase/sphingolipid hydroxylase (fatty acid hydroxylase superfamily)